MANGNPQLIRLAADSALAGSAAPVMICDENLIVCAKSSGAKHLMRQYALGNKITRYLPKEACSRLTQDAKGACLTTMQRDGMMLHVIAVRDSIDNIPYIALTHNNILYANTLPSDGYCDVSCQILTKAIHEQLSAGHTASDGFLQSSALISHMSACMYMLTKSEKVSTFIRTDNLNLRALLTMILEESSDILAAAGVSIMDQINYKISGNCRADEQALAILTPILLTTAVLCSDDGRLTVHFDYAANSISQLKVAVSVKSAALCQARLNSYDALCNLAPHMKLEIAAMREIAAAAGIDIGCHTASGTLELYYHVPAGNAALLILHTSEERQAQRIIRDVFAYLLKKFS